MKTEKLNLENLKKSHILLEEIFKKAMEIRNLSCIHYSGTTSLKDMPFLSAEDDINIGVGMEGLEYKANILEKYNWDIKNYYNMAANVNVHFLDGSEVYFLPGESPAIIDNIKTEELVNQGLDYINKFKQDLGI